MPGEARPAWEVLLAHARPDDLHRCLRLRLGPTAVHLCARCAGLYPALAVAAAARLAGVEAGPAAHPAVRLGVPLMGGAAWLVEQAGGDLGKLVRVLSGVCLGAGLGWALGLHLSSPWPGEMVELLAALSAVGLFGLAAGAVTRRRRRGHEQKEPPGRAPGKRAPRRPERPRRIDPSPF